VQRLFETDTKVGVFLDSFSPRIERREGGEVKMIDLTMRVQPLTTELASTLAGDGLIKKSLFRLDDASPLPNIKSVAFNLSVAKQRLEIHAAPDYPVPSIAIDAVEISEIRARTQKGVDGWGLVFYGSFGPASKAELEFVQRWYTEQQFISFFEAEPSLELESERDAQHGDVENDADDPSQATQDAQREVGARQRTISHARGKKANGSAAHA
jgi:hypothetical protein